MKDLGTIREELKAQLEVIQASHPEVVRKVWELFKEMKTPEKVVEKIFVNNDKKEQELAVKAQSLESQLISKNFQIGQLKQEIEKINNDWEEKFTVYVDDVIDHEFLRASEDRLRQLHRDMTESITDRVPLKGRLTFGQKQMLLHLGFSEFHLLKTLSNPKGVEKNCFPIKIKKRL